MSSIRFSRTTPFMHALRKLAVSGFIVLSFVAYAVHERLIATADTVIPQNRPDGRPVVSVSPSAAAAQAAQAFQDGAYTGEAADAVYGLVRVEAIVEDGQISDIRFVQYPDHSRTSAQINAEAIPILKQEAIRAQSASVDIISGATLTSEAFAYSLYTALDQAAN